MLNAPSLQDAPRGIAHAVKIAEEVPTGRVVLRVNETDGKKTTAASTASGK